MTRRIGIRGTIGIGLAVVMVVTAGELRACMDYRPEPTGLVKDALSDDPVVAKTATDGLRALGPGGLGALIAVYDREIARHTGARPVGPDVTPETFRAACFQEAPAGTGGGFGGFSVLAPDESHWKRLAAAIDTVAGQKDAAYSGLYWYTDLNKAKAAARESGKPILSLRLLGTLDTEFSCANSRFFRTILYANAEVAAALRDRFVLHWQSVRPVPKVTIDMGDGRVIQRTITGNSAHYVLDADGRPLDAIPGLYGPKAFLRAINDAGQLAHALGKTKDSASVLSAWHAERAAQLTQQWEQDLASVGAGAATLPAAATNTAIPAGNPTAVRAAFAAVSKSAVEFNIVRALAPRVATLRAMTTDEAWAKIAALPAHAEEARLDGGSRRLVGAKQPAARDAGRLAMAKRRVEDPLVHVVANLERSVAEDTVRNEYGFHRTVHEWFASRIPEATAADVTSLNEKVYAELFLTPASDPWLGLVPRDTYSALEGDGIVRK